jgi:arylsulfate sulfotransferase
MKYTYVLLAIAIIACSPFERDPAVTFPDGNVLRPLINFSTHDSTNAVVSYWPTLQREQGQTSLKSAGFEHNIELWNLKEGTQYSYQIKLENEGKSTLSQEFTFVTDSVPDKVLRIRKDKIDTTVFKGYILVRRFFRSGADALINSQGDIVWYHQYDTAVRRAFTWTRRNTILSIYDSAIIQEIDRSGNTILDLNLEKKNLPYTVHHEVLFDGDDIVALTTDSAQFDLRKFGGKQTQYLRGDGLIRLSRNGQVLWTWSLLAHSDPTRFTGKLNLRENWGHANSIAIDEDGHYLVSFRDLNQIWKINRENGQLIWKLGENGDFPLKKDDIFLRQHSVNINARGEIMIFDNGDSKLRPNSRVMAFRIDEKNRQATVTINVTLPRSLSSYRMCSAELIDAGKYLVCTTRKDATIAVVNDKGEILWKVVADNASYRAYLIKAPFQVP